MVIMKKSEMSISPFFTVPPIKMKFTARFYVNSELTCSFENVPLSEVYTLIVPSEAFLDIPGNRWHVMQNVDAISYLYNLEEGEYLKIAWQEAPMNPELDIESIYVQRE